MSAQLLKPLPHSKCKALGVSVTPLTVDELTRRISAAVQAGGRIAIAGHNLHSVFLFHSQPEMLDFYKKADVVLTDGAPVLWDYRISGGRAANQRIGSTDWLPRLPSVPGLHRITVIGSTAESNAGFIKYLRGLMPNASIVGMGGENWDACKAASAEKLIVETQSQFTIIGLGMPYQERFALRLASTCHPHVIATVGGAIDQMSGFQLNAPRWLGRFGLEWLWRLATQPRRLARRYLVEPWLLVGLRLKAMARRP